MLGLLCCLDPIGEAVYLDCLEHRLLSRDTGILPSGGDMLDWD